MRATLQSRWMRRGIAAAVAIALLTGMYAVAGFVALPRIVRSKLTSYTYQRYHRALSLGKIHFNPFTLRLDIGRISFPDANSKPMLGARGLDIELGLSTLWRGVPTFRAIVLDQPFARVIVHHDGKINLAQLPRASQPAASKRRSQPFALDIDRLSLKGGRLLYEDRAHPSPFRADLRSIDFDLHDFRTVGTAADRYTLDFATTSGARFRGGGTLSIAPFVSHGQFHLSSFPMRTVWRYLRDRLHFDIVSGKLALAGRYTFDPAGASPHEQVNLSKLTLNHLGIRALATQDDEVDLGTLAVQGTRVDLLRRSLSVKSVRLDGGTLHASLEADGRLNLSQLMTGLSPPPGAATAAKPSTPWSVSVPVISVRALKLVADDREVSPAATVTLGDVAMGVRGLRRPSKAPLAISIRAHVDRTGRLRVEGSYDLGSGAAHARIALAHVDLLPLEPFLAEKSALELGSGWLTTTLEVHRSAAGHLNVSGDTEVRTMRIVDAILGRNFIKWRRLNVEGLRYRSKTDALVIRRIVAVAPYARVIVTPRRKLNILQDFAAAHTARPAPSAASAATQHSMSIQIGRVDIVSGSAHYTDLWIVPHFFLAIQGLNGHVTGLSSDPKSRATIDLGGKIDRYAPIRVSGTLNLFSATRYTNMKMDFHGVQLPMATPYSARFAGYKIKKGTMSADITYHLAHGDLRADPHFIINQLELGQKVASPDAIHLPLKFAIALLKDRRGVINLNLPLSGSLADPDFRVGPLIVKILVNLLTKAVTSPFALLGKLVGGGPQLQFIGFKPGSASLDAQARARLGKLAKALEKRPALTLDVPSEYAPTLDGSALARARLQRSLEKLGSAPLSTRASGTGSTSARKLQRAETRLRRLVALYHATFGTRATLPPSVLPALKSTGRKKTPPLTPAITALRSALLAHIHISRRELARLARRRALAIQGALLHGTHISPGRLFVLNTGTVNARGQAVRIKLALE